MAVSDDAERCREKMRKRTRSARGLNGWCESPLSRFMSPRVAKVVMGGKAGRSTHENRGSWCGREGPAVAVGMGAERTSMVWYLTRE